MVDVCCLYGVRWRRQGYGMFRMLPGLKHWSISIINYTCAICLGNSEEYHIHHMSKIIVDFFLYAYNERENTPPDSVLGAFSFEFITSNSFSYIFHENVFLCLECAPFFKLEV